MDKLVLWWGRRWRRILLLMLLGLLLTMLLRPQEFPIVYITVSVEIVFPQN
jgi:hypothetical protein